LHSGKEWKNNVYSVQPEDRKKSEHQQHKSYLRFIGDRSIQEKDVFRNMLGLTEAKWQVREEGQEQEQQQQYPAHDSKQSTLSDFLS
jgi:hypothetical protein